MGFYENDRIRHKNLIYNIPNPETNQKARIVINKCKSKGMNNNQMQIVISDEISKISPSSHKIVLETALVILKRG